MSTNPESVTVLPTHWSLAELQDHLGGIAPSRIRLFPPPGTANVDDVARSFEGSKGRCELIDGVLVEKDVGYYESIVAMIVARLLGNFVDQHDLGVVTGEAGTLRILPDQVRIPDVGFISWAKFPSRKLPAEPIPSLAPDLAVEILSPGNTPAEMQRKLRDYFAAGVRLVWYIDCETQTARAYASADDERRISADQSLDGGAVLPGFQLSLAEVFKRAGDRA